MRAREWCNRCMWLAHPAASRWEQTVLLALHAVRKHTWPKERR